MNFRGGASRRREMQHLDLTPMIDVMFNLVLFLLLATTFKKMDEKDGEKGPGIQVDLPRASAQAVLTDKEDINVWMSKDGGLFVNDEPVTTPGLEEIFRSAAKKDPSTLVVIKADMGVAHGRVVTVMDLARNEGLTRLAIATTPAEGHGSL